MGTLGRSQCRRASQTHRNRKKARSGNGGNESPADSFCLLETGLETRCRCCRGASFRFSCAGETLRHWLRPRVPVKDRALLDRTLLS